MYAMSYGNEICYVHELLLVVCSAGMYRRVACRKITCGCLGPDVTESFDEFIKVVM